MPTSPIVRLVRLTLHADPDPAFRRQLAGHLETGKDSMSDPALGD